MAISEEHIASIFRVSARNQNEGKLVVCFTLAPARKLREGGQQLEQVSLNRRQAQILEKIFVNKRQDNHYVVMWSKPVAQM
jgi:hypothetical protein